MTPAYLLPCQAFDILEKIKSQMFPIRQRTPAVTRNTHRRYTHTQVHTHRYTHADTQQTVEIAINKSAGNAAP